MVWFDLLVKRMAEAVGFPKSTSPNPKSRPNPWSSISMFYPWSGSLNQAEIGPGQFWGNGFEISDLIRNGNSGGERWEALRGLPTSPSSCAIVGNLIFYWLSLFARAASDRSLICLWEPFQDKRNRLEPHSFLRQRQKWKELESAIVWIISCLCSLTKQ